MAGQIPVLALGENLLDAKGILPRIQLTEEQGVSTIEVVGGGTHFSGSALVANHSLADCSGGVTAGTAREIDWAYKYNGTWYTQPLVATGSGGVQVSGRPSFADFSMGDCSGGVTVTGDAPITFIPVRLWPEAMYGGVKLTTTATVVFDWINAWPPTGGVAWSGTATVSVNSVVPLYSTEVGSGGVGVFGSAPVSVPGFDARLPGVPVAAIAATFVNPVTAVVSTSLKLISTEMVCDTGMGGYIDTTLPKHTATITASLGTLAQVDAALPALSSDIAAGPYGIATQLPLITASISAVRGVLASVSARIPTLTSTITAMPTAGAVVDARLPALTSEVGALLGVKASIASEVPTPAISLNAVMGTMANLDAALTRIGVVLGGYGSVSASITGSLPSMTFSATARVPVAQVATYVTGTLSTAVSLYEQFPFNSFAVINGKYYGAGPTGLFELVGDKDYSAGAVADVTASLRTGQMHFGSEMQKRMSDFFIAMRSDGDITLRVMVDEQAPLEYTLSPLDIELLKQRRSLIGKGAKGKYWQFEFENTSGCNFDFDSFNAAAVVLGRRL